MSEPETTKYLSEEVWLQALKTQMSHLGRLEGYDQGNPREIAKTRHRIERIWNNGLSEWRAKGMPSKWPQPK
jgi:hypothetical protein